jgi:protein tyrosine/serine phosphatase
MTMAVLGTVGVLLAVSVYRTARWKRFSVIVPERVYRSGQLTKGQFDAALFRLRLKRVICLAPEHLDFERDLCAKRGVDFHFFDMPSDGMGRVEYYQRVLELMSDEEFQPVLVHCNAGVARTGASSALFRVLEQGWPIEKALAELASFERLGRIDPQLKNHVQQMARDFARPQPVR